jgi:hypothetical protein
MPPTLPLEELARRGKELYSTRILPLLSAETHGRFVAVDVMTGDYEVGLREHDAVSGLRGRHPNAEIWMERSGFPTTYKMRAVR